jgi:hypothetical protein
MTTKIVTTAMLLFGSLNVKSQVIVFKNTKSLEVERMIRIELEVYPSSLIAEYLDTIIVMNDLKVGGRAYFTKKILLNGSSDAKFLRETIHHELSSVFLLRYDVYVKPVFREMERKFIELNGKGFAYNLNTDMSNIEPNSPMADYYCGERYAQNSFENDWNEVTQTLFTNGRDLIDYIKTKPNTALSCKVKAVISFYFSLNEEFTEDFFSTLKYSIP